MKKKDLFVKAVTGLTASSILVSSCTDYWVGIDNVSENGEILTRGLSDEGTSAILIDLSQHDVEYLNFLIKLTQDIVQDPVIARQFVKNPDAFVEDYGYEGGINLDEGMLKLILALGDEDINKAVNQNDMLKVLDLMESKGLLDGVDEIGISLTNEQIRKIYENLGIKVDASEVDSRIAVLAVPVVVYAVAIAYSQAAVLYNVAGALNVLGAINVYAWSELWGRSNEISEIVNGQLPLKLWNLKGHSENTYMVVDEYVNIQVGRAIAIMKEHNSDLLRYIDEDELARLVKYNIIQNCK